MRRDMQVNREAQPKKRQAGRTRVLVEESDGAMQWAIQGILDAEGYDVAVCGGPHSLPGGQCPLVEQGGCSLAEDADIILNGLRLSDAENRAVLSVLRAFVPSTPIIVETSESQAAAHPEALEGCQVALTPLTSSQLRRHIHDALSSHEAAS